MLPLPHHSYHNLPLYDHPAFLQLLWILSHSPFWRSECSGPGVRVGRSGTVHFVLVLYDYQGLPGRLWVFIVEYAPSTSLQFSGLYREHPWFNWIILTILGILNFEERILYVNPLNLCEYYSNTSLKFILQEPNFKRAHCPNIEYCVSATFKSIWPSHPRRLMWISSCTQWGL